MKRSFIIALHIGYWILYLLMLLLFIMFVEAGGIKNLSQDRHQLIGFFKLISLFTILPAVISFYSFYSLLFKKYLSQKKIVALCVSGLIVALLSGLIGMLGLSFLTGNIPVAKSFNDITTLVLFMSILAIIHGIIALVMKGFINWYADIKLKEELQQKNFETELALVKSQLNPHFLFNCINNIDVLIKKDADMASEYLNKLSAIMRFMLYETRAEKISLQDELSYIKKYIDLQKIRTTNVNFLKYTADGDANNWTIAPMLFIPFIENAFKHAVNKKTDLAIAISLKIASDRLDFYCENHFSENLLPYNENSGLGNELLKKRLILLYPGKHDLKTEKKNDVYKVHLTIYANHN